MNDSNQSHPQKFKISYDCFPATLFNVMSLKDGQVFYSGEKIVPDNKKWEKFWKEMEKLDAWNWKKEYFNYDILDGCRWSIHIEHNGQKIKSEGSNNWPKNIYN